jgi:hypothetical protein
MFLSNSEQLPAYIDVDKLWEKAGELRMQFSLSESHPAEAKSRSMAPWPHSTSVANNVD